jgi:raffinose/stachyose/melibiose transport system substrate-binding protein
MRCMMRSVLAFSVVAIAVVGLAACGSSDKSSTKQAKSTTASGQSLVVKKNGIPQLQGQKITIWAFSGMPKARNQMFTDFGKQTGAKVTVRKFPLPYEQNVLTKLATGEKPDLLMWDGAGNWMAQLNPPQKLVDLTNEPFVKRINKDFLVNSVGWNGKIYGGMTDYPAVDLAYYNKAVLAKLGAKPPTNFADTLALCKTIQAKLPGVDPIAMGGQDKWPLQIPAMEFWNNDIHDDPGMVSGLNTGKLKFTDARYVDGVNKEKQLADAGCFGKNFMTQTFDQSMKKIITNKAALMFMTDDGTGLFIDAFGAAKTQKTLGVFGISARDNKVVSWQAGSDPIVVPKTGNAKGEAAAKAFIDWSTSTYYPTYLKNALVRPIVTGAKPPAGIPPLMFDAQKLLESNNPQPLYQVTLKASYGFFENYLSDMLAGQKSPTQVMQSMQNEFQRTGKLEGLPGFR